MKTSTEILNELKAIPGIQAATIVARDGFVIESIGELPGEMQLDWLGASIAMVQNGTDQMSSHLKIQPFHTITLESADSLIVCYPIGEALLAIQAPDSSAIGMIRVQIKRHLPLLAEMF